MEQAQRDILIARRVELVEDIDIQGGLFTQLLSRKVLNRRTVNKLRLNRTPEEQVEELLNELPKRECFEDFCEALIADDQEHIVKKYLKVPLPDKTSSKPSQSADIPTASATMSENVQEPSQTHTRTPDIDSGAESLGTATTSVGPAVQAALKRAHPPLPASNASTAVICIREEDNRHLYIRYTDGGGGGGATPEKRPRALEDGAATSSETQVFEPDETRYAMKHYVSQETGGVASLDEMALATIPRSADINSRGQVMILNNPQSVALNPNISDPLRYSAAFTAAHNLRQVPTGYEHQNFHQNGLSDHSVSQQRQVSANIPPSSIIHNATNNNSSSNNTFINIQQQQQINNFAHTHPPFTTAQAPVVHLAEVPPATSPLKDPSTLVNKQPDMETAHIRSLLHAGVHAPMDVDLSKAVRHNVVSGPTIHFTDPHQYLNAAGLLTPSKSLNSPNTSSMASPKLNRYDSVDKVTLSSPAKSIHVNPIPPGLSMSTISDYNELLDSTSLGSTAQGITAGGGDYDLDQIDLPDGCVNVKVEHTTRQFFLANHKKAYPMRRIPRGLALIINVDEVEGKPPRKGTNFDRENLCNLLCQLHFNIIVYNDKDGLSAQEMVNKLKDFAKRPEHAEMDACFVCLLSHGEEGFIFGTDGKRIPLEEIFMLFGNTNCRGLIGKPKVFIIQACRGGFLDKGVRMDEVDGGSVPTPTPQREVAGGAGVQLPSMSDMLVCYPTLTGYYAWRNRARGSWYIEAIVQVFMKYAKCEDVCAMLNRVNLLVSKKVSECNQKEMNAMSQMSEYKSSLRQPHLFLFPGIGICMS